MTEQTLVDAINGRRSVRTFDNRAVPLSIVERLVHVLQGSTDGDGNRSAPSAHGLHPLSLMVTAGDVENLATGLYSINCKTMNLEPVHGDDVRPALRQSAVDDQSWVSDAALIITICADMFTPARDFAEQKPYGSRGSRYVYIEAGAAAQNAMLLAVNAGLGSVLVAGFDDDATARALGISAPIAPVLHLCFGYPMQKA